MKIEKEFKIDIPSADIDYREVARLMRINIDIFKKELSDHVSMEIDRFHESIKGN